MKELETERERRWKAEQASKKLLNHIQALQGKGEVHIKTLNHIQLSGKSHK